MRCADPRSFGKIEGGSCHLPTCAGSEGLNLSSASWNCCWKWCQISTESKDGKMNFTAKSKDVTQSTHRVKCMAPSDRWLSHIQKHPGWEWIGQACLVTARNHSLECSCAKWLLVGQESLLFMQFHSMKQSQMRIFDITSTAQFTVFSPRFCFPQMRADRTNLAHIENDAPQESVM